MRKPRGIKNTPRALIWRGPADPVPLDLEAGRASKNTRLGGFRAEENSGDRRVSGGGAAWAPDRDCIFGRAGPDAPTGRRLISTRIPGTIRRCVADEFRGTASRGRMLFHTAMGKIRLIEMVERRFTVHKILFVVIFFLFCCSRT